MGFTVHVLYVCVYVYIYIYKRPEVLNLTLWLLKACRMQEGVVAHQASSYSNLKQSICEAALPLKTPYEEPLMSENHRLKRTQALPQTFPFPVFRAAPNSRHQLRPRRPGPSSLNSSNPLTWPRTPKIHDC